MADLTLEQLNSVISFLKPVDELTPFKQEDIERELGWKLPGAKIDPAMQGWIGKAIDLAGGPSMFKLGDALEQLPAIWQAKYGPNAGLNPTTPQIQKPRS